MPVSSNGEEAFCRHCALQGLFGDEVANQPEGSEEDYIVENQIGRGGDGVVYLALDTRMDRKVALKLLKTGRGQEEMMERRFRAEIEAIARLDHPHIIPIYAHGKMDGCPFYTMKFMAGGALAERMNDFSSPEAAVTLFTKICRAVHHAHERGVLHRDLKPSNILLDEVGEPYVGDFGLAKRHDQNLKLTVTGSVMGTPAYMSPEQARGDSAEVTTTSDIFSLGAILFQILTKLLPFGGKTTHVVIRHVIERDVQFPKEVSRRIDEDLKTICLKCLEKDPAKRFSSALALAEDLERWREGLPILARPVTPVERMGKWIRRRPAIAGLLGVSLLSALIILAGGLIFTLRLNQANGEISRRVDQQRKALVQLTEESGLRAFEQGDYFQALPWLVATLQLESEDPERVEIHRRRIGAALRASPRLLRRWQHPWPARESILSGDGNRLLVVPEKGAELFVTDVTSGTSPYPPLDHGEVILAAAMTHDGQTIATAGASSVKCWDGSTGSLCWSQGEQAGSILHLAFLPGTKTLLSVHPQGTVMLRDLLTGNEVARHDFGETITKATIGPEGQRLAVGGHFGAVAIFDLPTFSRTKAGDKPAAKVVPFGFQRLKRAIHQLTFSPDGGLFLAVGADGAQVFDTNDGSFRSSVFEHASREERSKMRTSEMFGFAEQETTTAAMLPKQGLLATGSRDRSVHVWRFEPKAIPLTNVKNPDRTTRRARHHDPVLRYAPMEHRQAVNQVAFSPDGRHILTSSEDRTAVLWDSTTGRRAAPPLRHFDGIHQVAFDPSGSMILTVSAGETRLWSRITTLRASPIIVKRHVRKIGSGDGGDDLLIEDEDGGRHRWRINDGQPLPPDPSLPNESLSGPLGWAGLNAGRKSSDGRQLVVDGSEARVVESNTGQQIAGPAGHGAEIAFARFSGGGRWLLTGSTDRTTRLWDARTSFPITPPLQSDSPVLHGVLSDAQDRLITCGTGSWVSVWDVSAEQSPIEELEHLSTLLSCSRRTDEKGLRRLAPSQAPGNRGLLNAPLPSESLRSTWAWNSALETVLTEGSKRALEVIDALSPPIDRAILSARFQSLSTFSDIRVAAEWRAVLKENPDHQEALTNSVLAGARMTRITLGTQRTRIQPKPDGTSLMRVPEQYLKEARTYTSKAADSLEFALQRQPWQVRWRREQGELLSLIGVNKATSVLNEAVVMEPGNAATLEARGSHFLRLDRRPEAWADFRAAAKIRRSLLQPRGRPVKPIPARTTATPEVCLDLGPFYTTAHEDLWIQGPPASRRLASSFPARRPARRQCSLNLSNAQIHKS
jgi:WD40 repeat protein